MNGFLTINKPSGITSFGVIARLRRITGIKKIGHCGTLDPLATGVLVCAIGRDATRRISGLTGQDKRYTAKIELGKTSTTYDMEGEIKSVDCKRIGVAEVREVLKKFTGEILQMPPIFSAKKIGGERAYKLARKGIEVKLEKSKVNIKSIKIIKYSWPFLEIDVACGKGTYIRSLANDIGEELGCGGVLTHLERTAVGDFNIKGAVRLEDVDEENWKLRLFQL